MGYDQKNQIHLHIRIRHIVSRRIEFIYAWNRASHQGGYGTDEYDDPTQIGQPSLPQGINNTVAPVYLLSIAPAIRPYFKALGTKPFQVSSALRTKNNRNPSYREFSI